MRVATQRLLAPHERDQRHATGGRDAGVAGGVYRHRPATDQLHPDQPAQDRGCGPGRAERPAGGQHRRQRQVFINKDEVQPQTLEFNLQAAKAKDPDVRVQLQADNGVNYGEVARAMASIERAGITKLSVITAK